MLVADFKAICEAFSPSLPVYVATDDDDGSHQLPALRVGHHNPPEEIHADVPVELFTAPWHSPTGAPITLQLILAELAANHAIANHIRIAVPTDQGHHRILDILKMSVTAIDGNAVAQVECEPWNGLHHTIRVDQE